MTASRPGRAAALCRTAVAGMLTASAAFLGAAAVTPHAVAGEPDAAPFVQIRVDTVTPDVITTTSDPVVTVTGTVTNIGDRPVRDVMVRLEQAAAVASSAGLRTNLDGADDQYRPVGGFATVAAELQRGQDIPFTLSAPLRSAHQPALDIDRPGVYPVLVNVNGTPDYGEPARLDDARFLLPVTGVPANPDAADGGAPADVVPPDISEPVRITMLWPLADRPRLTPGVPGGTLPVRLLDDDLAGSLAAGGRLDALLSSVEFATSPAVDPDGAVTRSLCLAVDPDLLVTVNAMTAGYVVAGAPDTGAVRPGAGQAAATVWLNRLRGLAHRVCVAPMPYAQADLNAVHRVGDPGLGAIAVTSPADIIDRILNVTSVRGTVLLADGKLTGASVDLLGNQGSMVAIVAGDCSAQDSATGVPTTSDVDPYRVSAQVSAVPFDPAVGAALAAVGADPVAPTYLDPSLAVRLRHDSAAARRQDALGSMLWRGLEPSAAQRREVLLPPGYWNPRLDDAQSVLTALATAIRSGLAVPHPLAAVVAEAAADVGTPRHPPTDDPARGRFDTNITTAVADQMARLWGLTAALTTDPRTGLTGERYTAPLREDMLRALTQSEPPHVRNGLAASRLGIVTGTIDDLFGAVTIVNPAGAYTLATEHSPLPLALRNDLAVPIRVRLHVDAPPGMTVTDVGEIELPPGYLPLLVPVEVHFNQRVAVDVALRTPDGFPLGEPARLSVHANAYGMVLFLITMAAAAVLIALAGRRLWHRFRGQPDPADLDRPDPAAVDFTAERRAEPRPRV